MKFSKCRIIFLTASITLGLFPIVPAQAILNSTLLSPNQLPQMSGLRDDIRILCSAALIGPRVIITAAHCSNVRNQFFGPVFGKYYRVTFTAHPSYSGNVLNTPQDFAVRNDLAIGILESAVEGVTPLSVSPRMPAVGETVLIAGIGSPSLGVRQFGTLRVVGFGPLGITLRGTSQVGSNGDSGGPTLISNNRTVALIGVNSTSTVDQNLVSERGPLALPYTMGIAKALPQNGTESFLVNFAREKNLKICGVNARCAAVTF